MSDKISKTDADWRTQLTPEQYRVCREHGTEAAFSGAYAECKTAGSYRCVCCDTVLFDSDTKFDSGTGWPSFYAPADETGVATQDDNSFFMRRVEVLCARCDAHLGHLFPDGPAPTGKRYCINSVCLKLDER